MSEKSRDMDRWMEEGVGVMDATMIEKWAWNEEENG